MNAAIAIVGVMIGWILFGVAIAPMMLRPRTGSSKRSPASLGSMALQGLAFAIVWGWRRPVGTTLLGVRNGLEPWAAGAVVLLAVLSGLFGVWAVRTLGKQWSLVARLAEKHELITTGPYGIVRHPIYSALLGLLIATGAAMSEFLPTVIAAAIYIGATMLRVGSEERLLSSAFGAAHTDYKRRVRAFIPGIW
jgi:protein-S-isoprenylcysteine O-methyltransferase Ste14